jgi:hypothetical protein
MQKLFAIALSLILFSLVVIFPFAVGSVQGAGPGLTGGGSGGSAFSNPLPGISSVEGLVKKILDVIVQIGILIAALAIVYSGLLFTMAGGKQAQIEEAKKAFYAACIGTAILLGAWVIAMAIKTTINGLR